MSMLLSSCAVRELPELDRPRERLAALGPEALRDAELIAVLLRTGTRQFNAVALGDRLVRTFGDLRGVAQASLDELQAVPGIGRVKGVEIKAAMELGKRLSRLNRPARRRIRGAADVADLLMLDFKDLETEHFKALLLNIKHEVRRVVDVSRGSADQTVAFPRDVFRAAVREGATGIIVCHNHPSGDPEPSRSDVSLTQRLAECGELLSVRLLDHVVFGDGRYVSLKERGLL